MKRKHSVHGNNSGGMGKVITGLVVGSIVGAAVSLLMAPASGEETRRRIKDEVDGIQKKARFTAGQVEEKGREIVGEAQGSLESAKENIVDRITRRTKSVSE